MESVKQGKTIILTPKWFIGLRVVQIVISLAIVALAGSLIHGFYADPLGLAIAAVSTNKTCQNASSPSWVRTRKR